MKIAETEIVKCAKFLFILLFSILAKGQVNLPQCANLNEYLYRGDLNSSRVGSRTWHLDKILRDQRQNPGDACLNALKTQAQNDASEYWNSIKTKCDAGTPNIDCSKVQGNLDYINLAVHNRIRSKPTASDPEICVRDTASTRNFADVAKVIEQVPPRTDDRNCPTFLVEQRKADRSGYASLGLRDASAKDCLMHQSAVHTFDAQSLEKYLSENPQFSSQRNPHITGPYCSKYLEGLNELEKMGVVADYYYYSTHLESAEVALVNSLSMTDRILEQDNFANNAACASSRSNKTQKACNDLKNCGGASGSAETQAYVARIESDLKELQAIDADRDAEIAKFPRPNSNTAAAVFMAKAEPFNRKAEALKAVIYQKNPILKSRPFYNIKAAAANPLESLKTALRESRPELQKKLEEARGFQHCLDKNTCDAKSLSGFLGTMPIKMASGSEQHISDPNKRVAMDMLDGAHDCQTIRGINAELGSGATNLLIDVGMATLSGGIGLAARGARLARTARALNTLSAAVDASAVVKSAGQAYESCMNSSVTGKLKSDSNAAQCGGEVMQDQWEADSQCTTRLLTATIQAAMFARYGLRPVITRPAEIIAAPAVSRRALPPREPLPVIDTVAVRPTPTQARAPAAPVPKVPSQLPEFATLRPFEVKAMFKGMPGKVSEMEASMGRVELTMAEARPMYVQNMELREIAIREGRIFRNISPQDLPRGKSFTFVVTDAGDVIYGQADSVLELGTKHFQLANGAKVVAAGEVKTGTEVTYNLMSGTFMKELMRENPEVVPKLKENLERIFGQGGRAARYTPTDILRKDVGKKASRSYYAKYCNDAIFRRSFLILCTKAEEEARK
jgi:hypothetical protein